MIESAERVAAMSVQNVENKALLQAPNISDSMLEYGGQIIESVRRAALAAKTYVSGGVDVSGQPPVAGTHYSRSAVTTGKGQNNH